MAGITRAENLKVLLQGIDRTVRELDEAEDVDKRFTPAEIAHRVLYAHRENPVIDPDRDYYRLLLEQHAREQLAGCDRLG